ncbi:probable serine/threonine-protein phosphatase 6 regulatory ankyrin repeat subunit [Coccomyxa sp. Obi]|nr:probable serine/threonine-protein phosphatase 6 regulatory ankyrin repeat subunit [Coccomyxa sp. Obi]
MEGHSVRTSGAGLRSSASAKEAWDVYVNTQLAPVLASALAINGKELPGKSDAAALLNLSMEQAQLTDTAPPDQSSNARESAQLSGCLTPAGILEEASTEQPSSATYDEALWAALAAAACRRSVPGTPAAAQESSQDGSPADRHGGSGQHECSPSVSGESSDADASDGWAGTFAGSRTEPSSFNGTFRAQRTRRTVRVVRTAARSRPPKEASPATGAAAPLASSSAPAPAMCRGSPRRTRKKRAAASLVEGAAFHAPTSVPTPGRDAGDAGAGRQRTSGSFSQCSPTHSAAAGSAALLGAPLLSSMLGPPAGGMPPLCSHRVQIGTPSSGSPVSDASTASKRQGTPRKGETPTTSLREPGHQQLDAAPSAAQDMAGPSSCWGRPPILLAAATGRADIVRHLLASAPKDPSPVRLEDFRIIQQNLEEAAQQAAALGTPPFERVAGSRPPGPLLALPSDLLMLDPLSLLHCTALHLAALHGHAQVAQVLLASPTCSIRSNNAEGATALHIAAREGWTQVVSLLARAPGCELDACDYGGRTALHLAALRAHTDVVNELWCRGCKIDPVDANGCTALHYAAEAGHTQVVANLVIAGCLVHTGTSAGWTAAHLAAYNGNAEVLQKLLVGGYEVDCMSGTGGWTALHLAAHNGHLKAVNVLLMAGANVELKCSTGADVLHCAAESGCLEVFERILEVGKCNVSGTDLAGAQLVHRAAMGGNGAIFQKLLDLGSDEAALTSSGRTTLHYAALGGHLEMTDWLLKRGAAVDHEDTAGVTPVMVAAEGSSAQLLIILLEHGANLHACSAAGCNALHSASCSGSEEVLDVLLEKRSDLEVVCQRGATVVHHAAEANRPGVLARLLQRAGQSLVRVQDSLGWTALHYAAMHEHCDCAALLIQAGAELNVRSTEGLTPLHLAARAQSTSVANLLLASGADGSIKDASSRTALHYAAQTGNWSLFHTLHEYAAGSVLEPDDRGLTPLHYAVEGGSLDIVGVLLAYLRASSEGQTAPPQSPICSDAHEPSTGRGELAEAATKGQHHQSPASEDSSLQQHASQAGEDVRQRCREGSKAGLSVKSSQTAAGQQPVSDGPCQSSHQQTPPPTSSAASFTPLHMAAYKGHAELIPYLLQAGYTSATFDALHRTPLHYAALQGCQAFELPPSTLQQADSSGAPGPASQIAGENDRTQEAGGAGGKAAQPFAGTGPSRLPWEAFATHSSNGSTGCPAQPQRHAGGCQQQPSGRATPGEAAAGSASLLPLTAGVMMQHVAAPGRQARGLDARPAAVQWTGLMPRARVDFPGASELLMAAGADVYAVDTYGRTALHYAAGTGDQVLVERLLELGVPMGEADGAGWTPLAWAAGSGHADCVSRLLEAGAGVGARDSQGRLPLHWAAERGWAQVVALLVPAMLQGGLDLHTPDKAGASAVALAAVGAHVECVAHILDSTATATERGLTALHLAVQDGLELLVTQLLLLPGATPDSRDKDGLTPLHWAASRGFDGIVEQLLVAGADIDAVTNDGWTALHEASLNGHTAVVSRLLQAGAQVGLKTSMGLTALHNAATNGHCEIVNALLDAGASPNARALSNATALFCAAGAGHTDIVRRLLAVGAEISVAAGAGATALHAAAGAGHLAVVEDLLGAHADVDVQAQNGATALHNAAGGGYDKIVKALLVAKADTDIQNSNCNTALHLAAGKGHVEVVETLLAAGASAHIRNAKGWAAVHSAAAAGQLEVVLRLVAAGAAPRSRPDLDVLRLLTRKTTYRHSYVEGRLRLAEKERQRIKSKSAAGGAQAGPSQEELAALEAQANANMAALLEEEEVKKDVEEKKKNKKKDRKKRKGKKGDDKEAEEEAEGPADDPKQDEASEASDHATPPAAEPSAAEGSMADTAEQSAVSTPILTAKQVKLSLAQPGKNGNQAKGGAQAVEASTISAPSHPVAAKGAAQKGPPKCPAKQDRARKGAPRQADAHAAGTASDKAAEEEADASEWQSVGAAQRKARRGHKALNPQLAGAPHQAALPTTIHHKAPQQQPPPPPLRGPPTVVGGTKPAQAAPARASVPAAAQEPRPSRHQAHAAETRAVAAVPAAQARGKVAAPSFAEVARPVQDRPAKATKRDAAAISSLAGTARAGSPLTQRAGSADRPLHVGAAAAQPTPPGAPQPTDMRRAAADTVAPASQQPASATPQQQLPVPPKTASTVAPGTPATHQPLQAPAALPAVPQPPVAPGSTLSALAKTWHPAATSAAPIGPPGAAAERRGQSREAGVDDHGAPGVGVRREGGASAAPISAAPAVWRSSLGTHSVDWSFPRTNSGTSLSSLVPPRLPANGGSGVDAASDRVTCSSLDSSASLCLTEGLLGAEPLLADGSPVKSSGAHGSSATSRLQYSSSPLGRMSMGSAGMHSSATAGIAPAAAQDYAAVLSDIWNSPQHEVQPSHPRAGTGQPDPASLPSPDATAASGGSLEVRRMAEAYQLTCPITKELMRDPVVASDGYTYERAAIEAWMADSMVSPRTGQPLRHKDLVPNLTLRASISILIPRSCLSTHF